MGTNLAEPIFTPSERFFDQKGAVKRMMRSGDIGYVGFAEIYCSTVKFGAVKGWKKHRRMTLNLCVLHGAVRFFVRKEEEPTLHSFIIDDANYGRLTVPPGLWLAFEGMSTEENIIVNMADMVHDSEEAENVDLSTFPIQG